jgi:hypothetical protein
MKVMRVTKQPCASFGLKPTMDLYLAFPESVEETNGKTDDYILKSDFIKILCGLYKDLNYHFEGMKNNALEELIERKYFKKGGTDEEASRK